MFKSMDVFRPINRFGNSRGKHNIIIQGPSRLFRSKFVWQQYDGFWIRYQTPQCYDYGELPYDGEKGHPWVLVIKESELLSQYEFIGNLHNAIRESKSICPKD